jgi:hypothetical protein
MTSNITVFKSYLKGTKTIKGYFPVYINQNISSEGVNVCDISEVVYTDKQLTEELLKETGIIGLVTQESNEVNTVLFVVQSGDSIQYYVEI